MANGKVKFNPEEFSSAVSRYSPKSLPAPANKKSGVGIDPTEFGEQYPVDRPDVPKIEDQLPQEATDGSLISGFFNVMDNIVPDDMGGLIRGTSGWMSNVPLYRETVGTALGAPLSAAETAINVMNWGSEQMNHLGAALMSVLPGGIQTLDWEQSQNISLGQVVAANAAINARSGATGWLINVSTSLPYAITNAIGQQQDPANILYSKDFDILSEEDRKAAFESGGMGQISSGFADAVWLVAADPTIVGGKVSNVIRFGTKAGEFGGVTNKALRTTTQIRDFASTIDDQAKAIKELGIEGARSSGRINAQGEYLIEVLEKNADELANHPWVKSSTNARDARALLGATSVEDPITAAYLVGAMAGDPASWAQLRQQSDEFYEAAANAISVDTMAPVGENLYDTATAGITLTDDQLRLGDGRVYEMLSEYPELVTSGQMIMRAGSTVSPMSVRAASAWRTGANRAQFENNAFKRTPVTPSQRSRGNFVYDTIEGVAGSRPLEVIRWLGKGTPNGIVNLKDGADGAESLNEVTAWLTKSPLGQQESAMFLNDFAMARTVTDRKNVLAAMEARVVSILSEEMDLSPKVAKKLYNGYVRRRGAALENISKSETNFYIDPDTGKQVKVPDFYGELDQAAPLLDVKEFRNVIKNNSWLRGKDDLVVGADYLNSLWKVSVLLRLGYTQRNLLEGSLRSFATLGLIASNPQAWLRLPGNALYYAKARRGVKGMRAQERRLMDAYENLADARLIIEETRTNAGFPEMQKLQDSMQDIQDRMRVLREANAIPGSTALPKNVQTEINSLQKEHDKLVKKYDKVRTKKYEPMQPELADIISVEDSILREIDDISAKVLAATELARKAASKRKITGRRSNIMRDGMEMPGAFQGQDGAIALLAASADRTTYMTFDAAVGRRVAALEASADFKTLDPKKLKPEDMQTYFDEFALRINRRYRTDPVGRMILQDRPVEEIKAFLMSDAGKNYRKQLSTKDRPLRSEQDVDSYIESVIRRLDNEMPQDTGLRQLALDHELTPAEVAAGFKGKDLPAIPGRIQDGISDANVFMKAKGKVDSFTTAAMNILGTIPENKMLRHPFYAEIFELEQRRLYSNALDNGIDITLPLVQNRISKSAHRAALKATRETMYTVERLSNAANMLRFVSPFFPAWENSIRTWGKIIWDNPAIAGYGNIFWNIPNNLGLVFNEYGEPVERSNMFRDEGNFVMMPEIVGRFLEKDFGPFNRFLPGQDMRFRQQTFNTALPGAEWWFAGIGPAVGIPIAMFLRGKPEDAEVLRNALGDEMYAQIVPSANPNLDLIEAVIPTFGRRLKQMWNGTDSDGAYLTMYNQILEDEYIKAQLDGRTITDADMRRIQKKAERYWTWQIGAAGFMAFQGTISSPYQPQRDFWNKLLDDESLTYSEKIKAFQDKFPDFGDAILAITRSGSLTETKLRPNLETWQRITKNPELVDKLYELNPELVGMFGNMGSFDEPWSYAVYGEFAAKRLGPGQTQIRRKLKPSELVYNNEVADGWREYWKIKDFLEDEAIRRGYSSLQVEAAKPLKELLDNAEIEIGNRYEGWRIERDNYSDKLPLFIQGARILVENAELINEDKTMSMLADYLSMRDDLAKILSETKDPDRRRAIKELGYAAAFEMRQKDIGFADFYDQYLDRDDFREIS
jgi:hypothetical protein